MCSYWTRRSRYKIALRSSLWNIIRFCEISTIKILIMIAGYSTILDNITTESQSKATIAPMKNSTLTGFPINPKDDIDPGMSNTTSTTTRRPTTTKPRLRSTTTTVKAQTRGITRRTTSEKPTQQAETKETPFVALTTKYIELQDRSGISVSLYIEKVRKNIWRDIKLRWDVLV